MTTTVLSWQQIRITILIWASFTLTVLSQCDPSLYCSSSSVCDVYQTPSHCFILYNQTRNWVESDVLCRSLGAQLAEIYDEATSELFKTFNKYAWLNSRPNDLSQWTYMRNQQGVTVDASTIDSWQTHCGVLVQESYVNQDGGRVDRIWLTTRKCNERMRFICRKTLICPITGDDCVKVIKEEMSWYEARLHCHNTGSELLWINQGESLSKINPILQSEGVSMYFVGFSKRMWKWLSTKSDVLFCKWWYEDPDDAVAPSVCMHTYPSGYWGDVNCETYLHPVCMIEKNKVYSTTPTTEVTSSTTLERTTPTVKQTTTPLYFAKTITTASSSTSSTITSTLSAAVTPTNTTLYPTTPSTADTKTTAVTKTATSPLTTTAITVPLTIYNFESRFETSDSSDNPSDANDNNSENVTPSTINSKHSPGSTHSFVTSPVEDNRSFDDVTVSVENSEEPVTGKSILSYGVIAGVVVGITVSATCLVAAIAIVIHSRNKARRRLIQNLPTYSGDTCRSFVFDNVIEPAPSIPDFSTEQKISHGSKSIPLHYQNVTLTTDTADSNRGLTSREKVKERRKHTYVNLFRGKNNWPPSKEQCNC